MAVTLLSPHVKDLGGFNVYRTLPAARRRSVGPFVFFDQMGPAQFAAGQGIDVRPHPHIGLATITWLFEGAIMHRDSLGVVQRIDPGDVNWMTAGHGIVHSERSPDELRARADGHRLYGIQTWVALPVAHEETEPSFSHIPADDLPSIELPGVEMRLVVGNAYGQRAPTPSFSPIFYLAVRADAGARFALPDEHAERGVYLVEGAASVDGNPIPLQNAGIVDAADPGIVEVGAPSLLMLFGGAPLDGERILNWNFVASRRDAIDAARKRWREQRFPQVPGETEFIPLPDEPPPAPVTYVP